MNPYTNEDVMFDRLKDLQREMENSRAVAGSLPAIAQLVRIVGTRAWWLAGLAMRRAPRHRPVPVERIQEEAAASDAA